MQIEAYARSDGGAAFSTPHCGFKWPPSVANIAVMIRHLPIFLVLLAGSALAQSGRPPTQWIIDPTTKCKLANAFPSAAETITWTGACKDGYAEGKGVAQWF